MSGSKEGSIVILTGKLKFYRKILNVEKSAALKEKKKKDKTCLLPAILDYTYQSRLWISQLL